MGVYGFDEWRIALGGVSWQIELREGQCKDGDVGGRCSGGSAAAARWALYACRGEVLVKGGRRINNNGGGFEHCVDELSMCLPLLPSSPRPGYADRRRSGGACFRQAGTGIRMGAPLAKIPLRPLLSGWSLLFLIWPFLVLTSLYTF